MKRINIILACALLGAGPLVAADGGADYGRGRETDPVATALSSNVSVRVTAQENLTTNLSVRVTAVETLSSNISVRVTAAETLGSNTSVRVTAMEGGITRIFTNMVWDSGATTGNISFTLGIMK